MGISEMNFRTSASRISSQLRQKTCHSVAFLLWCYHNVCCMFWFWPNTAQNRQEHATGSCRISSLALKHCGLPFCSKYPLASSVAFVSIWNLSLPRNPFSSFTFKMADLKRYEKLYKFLVAGLKGRDGPNLWEVANKGIGGPAQKKTRLTL
jgi:hypothetical protein